MTLTPEREAEIRAWAGTSADPLGVPPGVSGSLLCELLAEIDRLRGELTKASDRETQQAYVRDRLEQAIRDALRMNPRKFARWHSYDKRLREILREALEDSQ